MEMRERDVQGPSDLAIDQIDQDSGAQKRKWPMITRLSEESLRMLKESSRKTRKHWGGFCKSTSIHGMRYLAEPGTKSRPLIARLWWLMVITIGLLTAYHYSKRQYVKWSQTTIDADNEDDILPLTELPFPAFTICDNRKLNTTIDENESTEERNLIYLICGDDRIDQFNYTQENLFELLSSPMLSCKLQKLSKEKEEVWSTPCDHLMVRTLTDQGVCYSFNMFSPDDIFRPEIDHGHELHTRSPEWFMDAGYREGSPIFVKNDSDPLQSGPFPMKGDIGVVLRLYHQKDVQPQFCYNVTDGYRLTLHNPDELPMVGHRQHPWVPVLSTTTDKYLRIPAFKKTMVDFKSRMIVPSVNMALYESKQRKCYFPGEKTLAYFRKYSYNNCQQECLTNSTKTNCGCIDYYMPRLQMPGEPNNITTVCTFQFDLMCALHFYVHWDQNRDKCDCLPSCTTIEHDVFAYYSHRDSDLPKGEGVYENLLVTEVNIFSSAEYFLKSERRAVYTMVDFIADCGGVFGLFCGASIISIVEIAYYGITWLIGAEVKCKEKKQKRESSD